MYTHKIFINLNINYNVTLYAPPKWINWIKCTNKNILSVSVEHVPYKNAIKKIKHCHTPLSKFVDALIAKSINR